MALEAVVFSEGFCGSCAMPTEEGGVWSGSGVHGHSGGMEGLLELGGSNSYWPGDTDASLSVVPDRDTCRSCVAARLPGHGSGRGNSDIAVVEGREGAEATPAAGRRKRRRARSVKNVEEVESQRMTHIAVERNRRKQMNEYLVALRSLMPATYVQRGDQASIIGGAINYVKELEQLVQSLQAHRHVRLRRQSSVAGDENDDDSTAAVPFPDFFTFPQYSMSARHAASTATAASAAATSASDDGNADRDTPGSKPSVVADIEVTIVESHASLKVLSRRRPRQLVRMVAGLQAHRLSVLHLNATSAAHMALYSLSLKVEDDCRLSSVDDIATVVHGIVETIEQEERQIDGASLAFKLEST